jgi:hypothetical protein
LKIQGEYRFAAPRQEVWEALLDPEVLSRTVPGSQGLERSGDNAFEGELKIKVGPVQGVFQGKVTLLELDPPRGYTLKLDGRGAPGFVNGSGVIALADDPAGGTLLHYDVDAQVGGKIAGVGQRLLESSAKVITRQALEALDGQIRARSAAAAPSPGPTAPAAGGASGEGPDGAATAHAPGIVAAPGPPASGSTAAPAPPPPSTARFAAGVVKGVVADLVPPRHRRKVALAGAGIGAILFVIGIRSCAWMQ